MEQSPITNLDNATTIDRLGFDVYVRQIESTIRDAADRKQLPLTIGVYGRWGSGKTSLMKMVEARLTRSAERHARDDRAVRGARFIVAAWIIGLIAGLLFAPDLATRLAALTSWRYEVILIGWLTAWFGAFGSACRAFSQLWWHASVAKDLDRSQLKGQALYPVVGFTAGPIVFLLLGGLLALLNVDARQPLVVTTDYVVAFFIGLFCRDFVVGLRAWWKRLRRRPEPSLKQREAGPQFQVIWFNAWKFAKEDELWAALLQRILGQMQVNARDWAYLRIRWALWKRSIAWQSGLWDVARKLAPTLGKSLLGLLGVALSSQLAQVLVGSWGSANLAQAAGTATGLLSGAALLNLWLRANVAEPLAEIDLDKYRKKSSYKDHLTFFADFSQEFKELTGIARGANNPIVLMLDDLDRCLPEQAVSILEAIKLFVGEEAPVVFLIGADREFIERAIAVKYAELIEQADTDVQRRERFTQLGHEYLEKIVQLPFNLPPIESTRIDRFIDDTFKDDPRVTDYSEIFAAGLLPNPRQVLRVINIYRFVAGLANERGDLYFGTIDLGILAKLVIIQYRWPDLYTDLVERNVLLEMLELTFKKVAIDRQLDDADVYKTLVEQYQTRRELKRLLLLEPTLVGVRLRDYLFLTKQTQSQPQPSSSEQAAQKGVPFTPAVDSKIEETESPANRAALDADLQQLREQIEQLKRRSGDSAFIGKLLETQAQAETLKTQGEFSAARSMIASVMPLAEKTLAELDARQREGTPIVIQANVSKGGQLVFQKAIHYEDVAIHIGDRGIEVQTLYGDKAATTSTLALSPELKKLAAEFAPQRDLGLMGKGLGSIVTQFLPTSLPSEKRIRFRIHAADAIYDELPWEAARISESASWGLDPRYAVVRDTGLQRDPVSALRTPRLKVLIAMASPKGVPPVEATVVSLREALAPLMKQNVVEVLFLEHATIQSFADALSKQEPHIVHLALHANLLGQDEWGGFESSDGELDRVGVDRLKVLLTLPSTRLLTLHIGNSYRLARSLASVSGMAVAGWQAIISMESVNAFGYGFYDALFRTGQVDYAITEGRRAIAARTDRLDEAVAPVLYLSGSEGTLFTN